jgi:predicted nuclease of predicted toxin-antitoxin system
MKVLIDECAPKALKVALAASGFDCTTVLEAGWSGKENGELLALADASFDVVVTIDRNLRYQQNLTGRRIALLIVRARSNRVVDLEPHFSAAPRRCEPFNRAQSSRWGPRRRHLGRSSGPICWRVYRAREPSQASTSETAQVRFS